MRRTSVTETALRARCTAVTGFDPVLSKIFADIQTSADKLPFWTVGASPMHYLAGTRP
jgi:hypothetical protein